MGPLTHVYSVNLLPVAIVGYPIVTVPLGFYPENVTIRSAEPNTVYPAPGVPIGLSFLGTAWSEASLVGFAYAYEQKTQMRSQRMAYEAAIPTTQLVDVMKWNPISQGVQWVAQFLR